MTYSIGFSRTSGSYAPEDGAPAGQYTASYLTVYFDTAEGRCLTDHLRGRRPRHKIRVRQPEGMIGPGRDPDAHAGHSRRCGHLCGDQETEPEALERVV